MAFRIQDFTAYLKKYPLAIGCGTLSVALIAGLMIRSGRAGELAALLKQKEQDGQRILDNVRDSSNFPEQCETLAAAVRGLESRLIRGSESADNLQYFYRLESETGVKDVNVQQVTIVPTDRRRAPAKTLYTGVGFAISVQGDYRQILAFIGRLESGPHFYRLVRASVGRNKGGGTGSPGTINLTLTLELLGRP